MPKYLFLASYTADGVKGLQKDKASGRKAAITTATEQLGGKVEAIYYAFGEHDIVVISDLPDNATASAFSLAVAGSGLAHVTTTPLLTIEETDKALSMKIGYRPPGS